MYACTWTTLAPSQRSRALEGSAVDKWRQFVHSSPLCFDYSRTIYRPDARFIDIAARTLTSKVQLAELRKVRLEPRRETDGDEPEAGPSTSRSRSAEHGNSRQLVDTGEMDSEDEAESVYKPEDDPRYETFELLGEDPEWEVGRSKSPNA